MKRGGLVGLVILLVVLLFHLPAQRGAFLSYDDGRYVVRNTAIDHVGNPARFFTDLDTTATIDQPTREIYRPIRTLSYALITSVFGKEARAFHAVSILLHGITALLLYLLIRQTGLGPMAAAAGALFWGLHPVNVEVTAWVCSLGDAWCALFSVASMILFARGRVGLAMLLMVAALFSKEQAVVLPGLWLAWDFCFRRERLRSSVLRAVLPGLALVIGFLVLRSLVGAGMAQLPKPLGGSHTNAVLTMLAGVGYYAIRILFPHPPSFDARVQVPDGLFEAPVLWGLLVLGALLVAIWKGSPRVRFGAAWFLIALVPVSNVLVPLKIPTADRFLYLPLMGLSFGVAYLFTLAPRWAPRLTPAYLLLLGGLTLVRIGDWRDDRALMAAMKSVNPKSKTVLWGEAALYAQRAIEALDEEDFARAPELIREAAKRYELFLKNTVPPEQLQVRMELGDFFHAVARWSDRLDQEEQAITFYSRALDQFWTAHQMQRRGVGRIIDAEREHAAATGAQIALRLALPENKQLRKTIEVGKELLAYLEAEFGRDIALQATQLVLVESIMDRAAQPALVRKRLAKVAGQLQRLEEQGAPVLFLKAQCVFFTSILKDQPFDRGGLERSHRMFLAAARDSRDNRLNALFHAARSACVLGREYKEQEWIDKAIGILDGLPDLSRREGLRMPGRLQRLVAGERDRCRID